MKRTLLLNNSYEVLSFLPFQKCIKLLFSDKDKVEVVSSWQDKISWSRGSIDYPAILRMKYQVPTKFYKVNFSRTAIVHRDKNHCQYCNKKLSASQITIDHVIPKSRGGGNTFTNCVVSCNPCNNKKSDRTPEEAGMVLIRQPMHPPHSKHYQCARSNSVRYQKITQ